MGETVTIRIKEPRLDHTEKLLEQVLPHVLKDSRVLFLCEPGSGGPILQRLRVMISRKRRKIEKRGGRPSRFRLHSTIHPETHDGKRYDACVCWRNVNENHIMTEILEDLLTDG